MITSLADKLGQFNPDLPLERAHTIPASWYHDADLFALERRQVFGNTWQAVGRTDQVSAPGSYFTFDLAGEPILVLRDGEGVMRAFYNVCRHRAAQVMNEPQGKATKLRCRYHGWTYDLTGRLRGTPEFDGVAEFRKDEQGLAPLSVGTWGPLVFVHPDPPQPLPEYLAPLPEKTVALGLDRLRFVERRDYVLNCNWKVYVDNYQDGGYHVNTVHPALAGALDYAHYRTETAGNTSVQISPLKPPDDPELAQVRAGDNAYYWWVFPNLMMNLYQGVMDTNLVLPLGTERCRVIFDFYFADTEGDEAKRFIERSIAVAEQVQREDIGICEEVQRGLNSRSFETGRFSVKREAGGYYFHQLLARQLRQG